MTSTKLWKKMRRGSFLRGFQLHFYTIRVCRCVVVSEVGVGGVCWHVRERESNLVCIAERKRAKTWGAREP